MRNGGIIITIIITTIILISDVKLRGLTCIFPKLIHIPATYFLISFRVNILLPLPRLLPTLAPHQLSTSSSQVPSCPLSIIIIFTNSISPRILSPTFSRDKSLVHHYHPLLPLSLSIFNNSPSPSFICFLQLKDHQHHPFFWLITINIIGSVSSCCSIIASLVENITIISTSSLLAAAATAFTIIINIFTSFSLLMLMLLLLLFPFNLSWLQLLLLFIAAAVCPFLCVKQTSCTSKPGPWQLLLLRPCYSFFLVSFLVDVLPL